MENHKLESLVESYFTLANLYTSWFIQMIVDVPTQEVE